MADRRPESGSQLTVPAARHAGQRPDPGDQRVEERGLLRRREIARLGKRDPRGQHLLGVEAQLDLLQAGEALEQQAGADQEHERQRHLRRDQHPAGPVAAGRSAPAAILERGLQVGPAGMDRGDQAETDPGRPRRPAG